MYKLSLTCTSRIVSPVNLLYKYICIKYPSVYYKQVLTKIIFFIYKKNTYKYKENTYKYKNHSYKYKNNTYKYKKNTYKYKNNTHKYKNNTYK